MKSVPRAKLLEFKGIFKVWKPKQQELTSIKIFIGFSSQSLTNSCVKWPWNRFDVLRSILECCMWSIRFWRENIFLPYDLLFAACQIQLALRRSSVNFGLNNYSWSFMRKWIWNLTNKAIELKQDWTLFNLHALAEILKNQ